MLRRLAILASGLVLVSACAAPRGPAEVELRTGSAGARADAPVRTGACGPTVLVARGDTLFSIARRCGRTVSEIAAANGLAAPYALNAGQTLRIPARGGVRVAEAPQGGGVYVVRRGDTAFSIARAHGMSVEALARMNRLGPDYALQPGQELSVAGEPVQGPVRRADAGRAADPARPPARVETAPPERLAAAEIETPAFDWPHAGDVVERFGDGPNGRRNDGVKLAVRSGDPVRAAADGEVVYAGDELQGYGQLVVIRHDDLWVTAYAHNSRLLVREGAQVRRGETIAEAGETGSVDRPLLHFEIRRNVTPVDPERHLPPRGA